ncbi:hypothetical protein [Jatrophihabitans fulvus]
MNSTRRRSLFLAATASAASAVVVAAAVPAVAGERGPRPAPGRATTIALPTGLQPEGITSAGSRYFVGSLNDGRIVTGDLRRGGAATVLLPGAAGRQIRGLYYEPRSKLVWAAGNVGTTGHVWAVDSLSGRVASDTVVPGAVFLNDLVATRAQVVVTDSRAERLTTIPLGRSGTASGAPRFTALGGAWPGAVVENGERGLSANGIRLLDKRTVVLDHSTAGGLWAVDLGTGKARAIRVTGGPAITAGDGLERRGATLWVVRGTSDTSVAQLRLRHGRGGWTASWQRLLTDPSLDVPSTATFALGALYAVNARFGTPSPATADYRITRLR